MSNFEAALEALADRDQDMKKLALYRAGKLALYLAMNEPGEGIWLDLAEKHLTESGQPGLRLQGRAGSTGQDRQNA